MRSISQEVRGLIHDQLQLATLELRLASRSLMIMILAAVGCGVLLVLVWAGLMAALGLSLVHGGLAPVRVVLVVTALTAVLAVLLQGLIRRRSQDLGLPATMRSLKPPPPESVVRMDQGQADQEHFHQEHLNQNHVDQAPVDQDQVKRDQVQKNQSDQDQRDQLLHHREAS